MGRAVENASSQVGGEAALGWKGKMGREKWERKGQREGNLKIEEKITGSTGVSLTGLW